jgi:predicted polyphosphate/ATP-dependent NAD kinase
VLGEDVARAAGFEPEVLGGVQPDATTAADTVAAARLLCAVPVDLLLFAGGDGTARDICAAIGTSVPALGIPAGVKMHSGVYAVSPEAAGEIVAQLVSGALVDVAEAEVRDLDEDQFRAGHVRSRHFGEMLVPAGSRYVQRVKQGSADAEQMHVDDIAADIVESMQAGTLYILGPGSTTHAIKQLLGIEGTLLGVDVVRDGACLARDAAEQTLVSLLQAHAGPAAIVVTAIGGQGHVFGRGNQQISAAVIRAVGIGQITIVAARAKIAALEGRPLLVDTNDPALDRELHRYMRVVCGYRDTVLYPVGYDEAVAPGE